ncbi:MAG: hypothetical protein JW918_17605 [Anaerolineae bacterium]|nr:hypothetical protein [Anaerolineae bacterium]
MGAADLQAGQVDEWLREGIAAAKAGQDERARELLIRVVACDERNAQAWLWLSGVAESLEDRKACLENVIEIDPDNAAAHKGLAWVQQQMEQQDSSPAPAQEVPPFTVSLEEVSADFAPLAPMSEPPVVDRTRTPVSPAAAMLKEDFAHRRSVLDLVPEAAADVADSEPSVEIQDLPLISSNAAVPDGLVRGRPSTGPVVSPSTQDEFSNEYACPYCMAATEHDDKRCKACGEDLWVKSRKYEKRSTWLWTLIAFQLGNAIMLIIPALWLSFAGLPFAASPEAITFIAFVAALPSVFSALVAAGLYFRWQVIYWLFVIDAVLGVVVSILAMLAFGSFFFGLPGFVFALARVGLIFQVGSDFELSRRRILFRLDPGLKSSVEYMMRADYYKSQRMWGLTVLHVRAAQSSQPNRLDCHMALAVAYIRLKRYDLADRSLREAKLLAPNDPGVIGLEALLDEAKSGLPAHLPKDQVV